jgi:hypothetical protein
VIGEGLKMSDWLQRLFFKDFSCSIFLSLSCMTVLAIKHHESPARNTNEDKTLEE